MNSFIDLTLDDDDEADRLRQRRGAGSSRNSSNTSRSHPQRPPPDAEIFTIIDSDDDVDQPPTPRPTFDPQAHVSPSTKAESPKRNSLEATNMENSTSSNPPVIPYIDSKGPSPGEADTSSVGAAGNNPKASFPATSKTAPLDINRDRGLDHPMLDTVETFTEPDAPLVETPRDASNSILLNQQNLRTIEQPLNDLAMEPQQPQWIGEEFTSCLQKFLREMRDDRESMTKILLGKACAQTQRRLAFPPLDSPLESDNPSGYMGIKYTSDPFANMKPIQTLHLSTDDSIPSGSSIRRFEGETFTASGKSNGKYVMTAPATTWQDDIPEVPDYTQYTSVSRNVLGTNTRQLRVWPYCGDEVANSRKFYSNIRPEFDAVVDDLPRKILWSQQASSYSDYFEAFLEEVGCSMDNVLAYLLDRDEELIRTRLLRSAEGQIPSKFPFKSKVTSLLTARGKACEKDFDRNSPRWILVYSALPKLDDDALWKAAWVVYVFWTETKFSAWQIARRFAIITDSEPDEETTYSDIACRICHIHDCSYHGENRERRDSDDDMANFTEVDRLDVDHPPKVNFRYGVIAPESMEGNNSVKPPSKEKSLSWWMNETVTWDHTKRGPFFPCHHPGKSCTQADCSCYQDKVCCEKICGCSKDCGRRYKGCSCKQSDRLMNRKAGLKICAQDDSCACFKMNRECDPDLCGSCGVHIVLDPANRGGEDDQKHTCQNAAIQLGVPKRTILGDSRVHGFGLYSGEPVKANEFVGEYIGEIITKGEVERRGVIYHEQNQSYLFNLNRDQEIDSQKLGNKIRFINHAAKSSSLRNLVPKIFLCNLVQRIGMFAIRDIPVGQEFFFDYGKDYHETLINGSTREKNGGGVVSKTHNSSLVNNLPDPESTLSDEDADDDDDIPLSRKRPRLDKEQSKQTTKPKIHLKAARKSQGQTPSANAAPPKLIIRNTKAAIKTAPSKGSLRRRIEENHTPLETAATRDEDDALAGKSADEGSDFEMKDAEEESSESEIEDIEPRRSGRMRRKSMRVQWDT